MSWIFGHFCGNLLKLRTVSKDRERKLTWTVSSCKWPCSVMDLDIKASFLNLRESSSILSLLQTFSPLLPEISTPSTIPLPCLIFFHCSCPEPWWSKRIQSILEFETTKKNKNKAKSICFKSSQEGCFFCYWFWDPIRRVGWEWKVVLLLNILDQASDNT